ncbi:putative protein JASON-like [Cocos nucifera]|uniref:Uncharacterized protein n=1 Tax=Cocos nucifera TaxID=13894 RepID=A0A8K0IKS1_COCNU|nr:putative protein JASON-like [Cocos nucifera]
MGWRRGSHKTDDRGGSPGAEGPVNGLNKREQEEDERRSLLPPAAKGGMAGKRKRSGRRKVRWNDSDGNKLVEVLEFQPRDNHEQGSFGSSKKKVTFDLNVKTYEVVLVDEDPKHSSEDNRENEAIREERKAEEADDESLPKSGASLSNHRYQNCEEEDDDDMEYGEEEEEEEDYDDIDLDEDDSNVVDIEGKEEESNASFLSLVMEKGEQCIQEVNSSKSKSVSPDRQPPLLAKGSARDRSQYVHPVLNPVENLTQWREVKVRAAPSKNRNKENINSDIKNKITFSPEPTFKIEKFQKLAGSNPRTDCPAKHDITVEASLSNWLASLDNSDKEGPQQSNSHFSKWSVDQEGRPTLGVLTVEDTEQSSVTSSPRRSPSRSLDEIPIAGAGTYRKIKKLKDLAGKEKEETEEILELVMKYFKQLVLYGTIQVKNIDVALSAISGIELDQIFAPRSDKSCDLQESYGSSICQGLQFYELSNFKGVIPQLKMFVILFEVALSKHSMMED